MQELGNYLPKLQGTSATEVCTPLKVSKSQTQFFLETPLPPKSMKYLTKFSPSFIGKNLDKYFVRFWGSRVSRKKCFEMYWPLAMHINTCAQARRNSCNRYLLKFIVEFCLDNRNSDHWVCLRPKYPLFWPHDCSRPRRNSLRVAQPLPWWGF